MTKESQKIRRRFNGTVVSDKAEKTISVSVDRFVTHPRYRKKYRVTKKYLVHDPKNTYSVGDSVQFILSKSISKRKNFVVVDK